MHGNIKITALVGIMFCITPYASAQLADTSWPMFGYGLNHTGLSNHYGPDTPTVKWTFSTGDRIYTPASIGYDDTIYIGTHDKCSWTDSKLYAVYPNGTEKWHWTPPSHGIFNSIDSTPAIASDGTIYTGCKDGRLYALYPNGTMKWEFIASHPWWLCKDNGFYLSSPAIGTDGTIYIGNSNHKLYAINSDGTLQWSYKTKGPIRSSPAVGSDGTIYIGSLDKKLYAIKPNGKLKWKYSTNKWIVSSPAIASDGTIYVGSYDKKLYAIKPNGKLKWKYQTGSYIRSSPAIGHDGTIYIGSYDRHLHAINPDGTLQWKYHTNSYIKSSPAIDADGTIYLGSYDKHLYAIDPDGSLLWKYNTGNRIIYSSPVISSDGTVHIGNFNGELYAFGPGTQLNTPPVLDPIDNRTINETEILIIDVNASDIDGDTLTYTCNRTNLFIDFNQVTGTGTWTTDHDDSGIYYVCFSVSDGKGGIDNETIRIDISNVNRPPVLDDMADRSVNENTLLEFIIYANDPDGQKLTYSTSNLPDRASFDPGTRTFSWTPSFDQAGTYQNVHFEVSDGSLTDMENITITVNNTNRPPVLDHIGDRNANENSLLEFTINASDPDTDVLAYSASNLPDGAIFDPGTRTFSWTASFEQSGTYPDIHFEVNDGNFSDYKNITIVVDNTNRPPVLDEIGDRTADENTLLEFTLTGTDPDEDGLTYSAFNLPDGADFDPDTQIFSWTPSFDQSGPYPDIQFTLSDGDLTDQENITIVVNTTNRAPVLDQIGNRVADENSLLEFTISATDPDGDGLTFSTSDLPDDASFDPVTRTFSWTPSFDQAGIYPGIYFEVYDSELSDWENITITVNNINRAPVLDPVGDRSVNENALLEFTISASDPDAAALSYCSVNLPNGAVFDPHSQAFSWTPSFDQSGTYHDIQFKVNDSSLTDHENITIVVSNINRPPVLDQITNRSVNEGSLLEFNLTATDPDGDDLAYDASNLPDGAVFYPGTGTFSWTPSFDQAATYLDVCFTVNDGNLTERECITITVKNTNRQPVFDQIGNKVVCEDSLLGFSISSVDPDGDEITYSAFNLPGGAIFNATTRTFSWTPSFGQAGTYPGVQFMVSDGEFTCSENITITVTEVAAPEIFVVAPDFEVLFQQQFIVNISVDPLMNEIYGVQYVLTFDNSVLHCEWQNEATFLNSDGEDTNVYINSINNGAGTISFAATRAGTTTGVTDPGILASIKFSAIKKGECTDLPLIEVIISDENGDRIEPVDIISSSICIDENQPPVAVGKSMHMYNNEGEKYLCKVTFNSTGSFDDDGEIVYWRWGFGDGQYGAGETVDHVYLSWNWNGSGYDPFTVTLTVTDDADPHQLDNTAFFDVIVYTAGDANGDGKVNILDATIIGLEWGEETTCGAYCWEGRERADRADLNNDCVINILDAVIIGTCWGHIAEI